MWLWYRIDLLLLLAEGLDLYGFDISKSMLNRLKVKSEVQGFTDIDHRISVQNLESFRYEKVFDAIFIPSNTFVMLTTQEAQIKALKNIYDHLAPGGKFLLGLGLIGVRELVEHSIGIQGNWYTWTHPETGQPIRQRVDGVADFNNQLILDCCFIEHEGQQEDFP